MGDTCVWNPDDLLLGCLPHLQNQTYLTYCLPLALLRFQVLLHSFPQVHLPLLEYRFIELELFYWIIIWHKPKKCGHSQHLSYWKAGFFLKSFERQTKTDRLALPTAGSLPKCCKWLGLGWAEAGSWRWESTHHGHSSGSMLAGMRNKGLGSQVMQSGILDTPCPSHQAKSSPKGNAFTSQCLKVSSIQKI